MHARATKVVTGLLLLTAVVHPIYYALCLFDPTPPPSSEIWLPPKPSFAACLLIKDDNDLLPEWLAYHYTVLPLRHVVVGVDLNSTQDPVNILEGWRRHTDLRYSILPSEAFADRYPRRPSSKEEKQYHHHELVRRQNGFVSTCSEYLKQQGAQWTAYMDTDEYVLPNHLGVHDQHLVLDGHNHSSMKRVSFQIRQHLPRMGDSTTTVADVLVKLQEAGLVGSCYTLPRLLVGALENRTCDQAQNDPFPNLSTLRYVQHAVKGNFRASKFGKVWMDLSHIPFHTLETTPRNIHRPYKDHCGPGSVHFPDAYFYIHHYIGSWERYSSRSDQRRNREEWEKRAFVDDGTPACESAIYEWLPRFVDQVGKAKASYLLKEGDW